MNGVTKASILILLILSPAVAHAADPYYFNRPGVERATFIAECAECAELAGGAKTAAAPSLYSPDMYTAMANAFFGGSLKGAEDRRMKRSVERICMADKGYARMAVADDAFDPILKMEGEPRVAALFALASSSTPIGKKLPQGGIASSSPLLPSCPRRPLLNR